MLYYTSTCAYRLRLSIARQNSATTCRSVCRSNLLICGQLTYHACSTHLHLGHVPVTNGRGHRLIVPLEVDSLNVTEEHLRVHPLVRLELPRLTCRDDTNNTVPECQLREAQSSLPGILSELLQSLHAVHDDVLRRDLAVRTMSFPQNRNEVFRAEVTLLRLRLPSNIGRLESECQQRSASPSLLSVFQELLHVPHRDE